MAKRIEKDPEARTSDGLTHLDEAGHAQMVDVGPKAETVRIAEASGRVEMSAGALAAIREGTAPKGDVLAAARIAGIQAAKRTADLIPLCHPLRLDTVEVDATVSGSTESPAVLIRARVRATDRTGVEMEALTAVSVAALTVYDMVKALDRGMRIGPIQLESKEGGRSGRWNRGGA